jgi:hypothetical protein
MATAIMTPKVPSIFWRKLLYQIGRRPRETDRIYQARQHPSLLRTKVRVITAASKEIDDDTLATRKSDRTDGMSKLLKFVGLVVGLTFVVIAFSGVKRIHPCHLTGVVGGLPTCDSNIQWFIQ